MTTSSKTNKLRKDKKEIKKHKYVIWYPGGTLKFCKYCEKEEC